MSDASFGHIITERSVQSTPVCKKLQNRRSPDLATPEIGLSQAVFLQFSVERPLADAQHLGRLLTIAGRQAQRFADRPLLQLMQTRSRQ